MVTIAKVDEFVKARMPEFYDGDYKKFTDTHKRALGIAIAQRKLITFKQGGPNIADAFEWSETPQRFAFWESVANEIEFEEGPVK